jgi:cytidylate kinase
MTQINSSIIIIGQICSGKSTLAKAVAKNTGFLVVSFGSYLKEYNHSRHLPIDRESLQKEGLNRIVKSPNHFLEDVIDYGAKGSSHLLFDGVRHKAILTQIKSLSKKSLTIYLDANYDQRLSRFLQREHLGDFNGKQLFSKEINHPVEKEIPDLKPMSDFIISSSNSPIQDFNNAVHLFEQFLK